MRRIGDRVGHIQIVGTLGQGGMGDVYVGFDEALHRKVALKAIRGRHRENPQAKARFLREARVLSKLDHPNICRIYDYVRREDEDYLVLELIEGTDLAQALKDGLDDRRKLGVAIQIATALTVAHGQGIVHRDLKPGNVMLTPDGAVKVLDFGLARLEEKARAADADVDDDATVGDDDTLDWPDADAILDGPDAGASLTFAAGSEDATMADLAGGATAESWTEAGQVVGTPLFMSPEQANGRPATAASDMYSFGLLLQTLFTGRPPFDTSIGLKALLEKGRKGETLPVEGVASDLRALIERLKATSPPARATAVDTLERLQWIRAKPKRRGRRLAAAAAVLAVILAGVKYTVDLSRERNAAVAARQVAEQRRGQAEDLIGFMVGDLRTKLEPLGRLEILDGVGVKAMEYFASVPPEDLSDDELMHRSLALNQIGDVRMRQGNLPEAARAFEEALTLAQGLAARNPDEPRFQARLGEAHFWVGSVYYSQRELEQALPQFELYLGSSQRLMEAEPDDANWQMEVAYAYTNIGAVQQQLGRLKEAEESFRKSVAAKEKLAQQDPHNFGRQRELANGLSWLATVLRDQGELTKAQEYRQGELDVNQRLADMDPENTDARFRLSLSHGKMAELCRARGDFDAALQHGRLHIETMQALVDKDHQNNEWQLALAVAKRINGEILLAVEKPRLAQDLVAEAITILRRLSLEDATNASAKTELLVAYLRSGDAALALHRPAEAIRFAELAEDLLQTIPKSSLETSQLTAALRDLTGLREASRAAR